MWIALLKTQKGDMVKHFKIHTGENAKKYMA